MTIEELNQRNASRLDRLGIRFPTLLLPREGVDRTLWSVVACDQYTSDHRYWNAVKDQVGDKPSTLHITLPEIYLEAPDVESRIDSILASMHSFRTDGLLQEVPAGLVYLERTTAASGLRQGLVFAMDLERYDYARDSQTLIRATEGTIVDRIPPRLRVRSRAELELPHIMILVDDPDKTLIEPGRDRHGSMTPLYSVDLMQDGGNLSAWLIDNPAALDGIISGLEALLERSCRTQSTTNPLFFAMGDGNHSLATAKAHWENTKKELAATGASRDAIMEHPARFALAEIVNIHSPGLRFEPIHRAVFTRDFPGFTTFLSSHPSVASLETMEENALHHLLESPEGQTVAGMWDGIAFRVIRFKNPGDALPPARIDRIFQDWKDSGKDARIDFIHGWKDTKKLHDEGALGFFVPVIARELLFSRVQEHGPLPRKAFSMGDAEEKKYYMECRAIRP